ncbi:MAG TPA: hypothetical protein VIC33_02265 [Vicinamibacterales bacterium]|jgi:hypothetical protein
MSENLRAVAAVLDRVRARWRVVQALYGTARAAAALSLVLLLALVAWLVAGRGNTPLLILAGVAIPAGLAAIVWGVRRAVRPASDRQIARLIEEQHPALEDRLASAVEFGHAENAPASPLVERLLADTAGRIAHLQPAEVIRAGVVRRAAAWAMAAGALLIATAIVVHTPAARAYGLAMVKLFPSHLRLHVVPGNVRVRAGDPLTIVATMDARHGGLAPVLEYGAGDRWRRVPMTASRDGGRFAFVFPSVTSGFHYRVAAGPAASEPYAVDVLHLPHVARIDLEYRFPAGLGLPPRREPDGGDIYAPPGTRVHVHITTDKPIAAGALTLGGGHRVPLSNTSPTVLDGDLDVEQDGSYRIALNDRDGLKNPGDTEYFIRMLAHRPPDVRILRPASDQQVTPLEEVAVDAHADAEYGIGQFDLVYSVRGGPQKVVSFSRARSSGGGVDGRVSLFLEDLHVKPGDLVSYYAQAHDATRTGAAGSARSDIFFLEVQPYEEQFTAAQSQAQGLAGGSDKSVEELAAAQKDIVVATWKLDRRNEAAGRQSAEDIQSVAKAQSALRTRVQEQIGQFNAATMRDPRQPARPGQDGLDGANDAMGKASVAMGQATSSLNGLKTSEALPHEMEALNQLLKAQAQVTQRQVTQQAAGAGSGDYRRNLDLSSLFDRELQRLQQTNYETPTTSTPPKQQAADQALDRLRDLARRQDELARQQQELANQQAKLSPEEMKRQLERLTRDQSELRRQAEEMQRELAKQQQAQSNGQQQSGQQGPSQNGGQSAGQRTGEGGESSGQMAQASKAMRDAAGELRKQNPAEASAEASRAADALRQLARRMEGGGPGADDTWRAVGDMRLQSSQLADAERQVASELRRLDQNQHGGAQSADQARDALRRIGGEKQRLADQAQQIEQGIRQLLDASRGAKGDPGRAKALASAADELGRDRLSSRMRQSADALRQEANGSGQGPADLGARAQAEQQMAQSLDRVSSALAQAGSGESPDARKMADQLSKVQQLRNELDRVQRQMDQVAQKPGQAAPSPSGSGAQGQAQSGQTGPQAGSQMTDLEKLRDDLLKTLQQTRDLLSQNEQARGAGPGGLGFTPEGQSMVLSAPGTEAFKQDFARWQSLQRHANAALEQLETSLSQKLQQQLNKDRLAAGGADRAPAAYQSLVDSYFKALAQKKPPQH